MNRRSASVASTAVVVLGLSCLMPLASASAAGPGIGAGRGGAPLICPGDSHASMFAISLASRAWSAASEIGGHRTLVPTSFALASFTGDPAVPTSYALLDARVELLGAKGAADDGATACVLDGTQDAGEGGFTAIVVNGTLLP